MLHVAIIHNQPEADRYQAMGESKAEFGVMDEVRAVDQALQELGYPHSLLPLHPPLTQVQKALQSLQADVVFNLFEGFDGSPETESQVAGMLENLQIPFTGCPSAALKLALDKSRTKDLLTKAGIPTPQYRILNPDQISRFDLDYPCIVKPVAEDASHGISENSIVHDPAALAKQVRKICELFGGQAMVEEYVDGREFNTTVIGYTRLTIPAISEIVYTLPPGKPRILTFESKWDEQSLYYTHTKAVCPAPITESEKISIGRIARKAFLLTGCRGYARIDLRQDHSGRFKVLEVNPNPDITPGAGASLQIAAAGLSYSQFIAKMIRLALRKGVK